MTRFEPAERHTCMITPEEVDEVAPATSRPVVPPISLSEASAIADVYALLSDPSRVRVLFTLLETGELCVCDLAEAVGMSQSALSHALRLLRTSGVVTNRRDGRMVRYKLADSHVRLLLDVTREHLAHDAVATATSRRAV